jgi:NADPH-dependent glutamate synthase beta subunit-like oxidoreductase
MLIEDDRKVVAQMTARVMYHRVDPEFKHKLLKDVAGETLKLCYQCGTCTAGCPVAHFMDVYRPNKILHLAKLGIRDVPYSNAVLLCSSCTSCTKGCPQGVRVHSVMRALKNLALEEGYARESLAGEFDKILETLREQIPLPVVYSWICLSPSDEASHSSKINDYVQQLLRHSLSGPKKKSVHLPKPRKQAVAIVGAGPAGLMAAWELTRMGFPVTIFESLPEPGGMLRVGIPEYRLPKDVLATEIERLKGLGIKIRTNTPVDQELFSALLKGSEFQAIFIAAGALKNQRLGIPGEDCERVVSGVDFLRKFNLGEDVKVEGKVAVIGGGNVAMDAARTAIRLGAGEVSVLYRRSRQEMPAFEEEIEAAEKEGAKIQYLVAPIEVLSENGRVTGVKCIRMELGEVDKSGRRRPIPIEGSELAIDTDMVIAAIGQVADLSFLGREIEVLKGGIAVDPLTMETNLPGVFAGGDAVSGPASVIEAMVAGRAAAVSVGRYLLNLA